MLISSLFLSPSQAYPAADCACSKGAGVRRCSRPVATVFSLMLLMSLCLSHCFSTSASPFSSLTDSTAIRVRACPRFSLRRSSLPLSLSPSLSLPHSIPFLLDWQRTGNRSRQRLTGPLDSKQASKRASERERLVQADTVRPGAHLRQQRQQHSQRQTDGQTQWLQRLLPLSLSPSFLTATLSPLHVAGLSVVLPVSSLLSQSG